MRSHSWTGLASLKLHSSPSAQQPALKEARPRETTDTRFSSGVSPILFLPDPSRSHCCPLLVSAPDCPGALRPAALSRVFSPHSRDR